jgi:5-formyltetrahydrofolate cyclo-ligase
VLGKREARRRAREAIKQLTPDVFVARGDRIVERVLALPSFDAARTVLLYSALADEVPTDRLIARTLETGKRLALPRISSDAEGQFEAVHCPDIDRLSAGAFGILEPTADGEGAVLAPAEFDLVVVPGRAFDRRGGRAGRGKGYYDRFLPQLRADADVIAVAFACQVFDEELETDAHDFRIPTVVTEDEVVDVLSESGA